MANGTVNDCLGRCCGLPNVCMVGVSLQKRNETRIRMTVSADGLRSLPCLVFRRPVEYAPAAATLSTA